MTTSISHMRDGLMDQLCNRIDVKGQRNLQNKIVSSVIKSWWKNTLSPVKIVCPLEQRIRYIKDCMLIGQQNQYKKSAAYFYKQRVI